MLLAAKYRRLVAALLLSVVVSPASAILPIGFGIGIAAGLTSSSLILPTLLSAAGVGAIAAMVTIHNTTSTPTAGNQAITAMLNPKAELPKRPAGWSAPAAGSTQPQAPATTTSTAATSGTVWKCTSSGGTIYTSGKATEAEACSAWGPLEGAAYYSTMQTNTWGNCALKRVSDGGLMGGCYTGTHTGSVCPSGYTLSGSTCTQTIPAGPAQKPSDGHCTIVRTGNAFSADPYDTADCTGPTSDGSVTISGDAKSVTATRSDGSRVEVRLQDDGTSTVIDSKPVAGGKTQVDTVTGTAPNATTGEVTVTGASQSTYTGQGAGTSLTADTNVKFDKSGLATEGTQQGIKDGVDAIKGSLVPLGGEDTSLSLPKSTFDTAAAALEGMFSGSGTTGDHGLTWDWLPSIPSSGACTNPTISMLGTPLTVDFCTGAALAREALSWIVYIFGGFMILTTLTGRKAGA